MAEENNKAEIPVVIIGNTIRKTMKFIDEAAKGIAFIIDNENRLCGVVTDGDIRRSILSGVSIDETPIESIMNRNPVAVESSWSEAEIKAYLYGDSVFPRLSEHSPMRVPVIDGERRIVDLIYVDKVKKPGNEKSVVLVERGPGEDKPVNKVLVIGGAGYLGSVLCRRLLDKGYTVRVLDSLMYGDAGIKDLYANPKFEFLKGDIRDLQVVMQGLKEMDAVIHLAAIVGDPASALKPQEAIEINYLSTKMIAETCKYYQINRLIFASTCSVYGASSEQGEILNEESTLNPVSLYALMKIKSENGIIEIMDENFAPTILRMATLYGLSPKMRFDLVVNTLAAKAVVDGKITIFGGDQWRPVLHVSDAAEAFVDCIEKPINAVKGRVFNVGSNTQNYRISELGEVVHKIIPEAKIVIKQKDNDNRSYRVSFDKIHEAIGYQTEYVPEDAVYEIETAIKRKDIRDFTSSNYNNYEYLREDVG